MQKALDQMNIQLHHVISDLAGATGLAIVDAILAGDASAAHTAMFHHMSLVEESFERLAQTI